MVQTYSEGLYQFAPAAPTPGNEAEGRPALVQAMVVQPCELVDASQNQGARPNDPIIGVKQPDLLRSLVHGEVRHMHQHTNIETLYPKIADWPLSTRKSVGNENQIFRSTVIIFRDRPTDLLVRNQPAIVGSCTIARILIT